MSNSAGQLSSFKASLAAASAKPNKPAATVSAKPSPSPAPVQNSISAASKNEQKRKRQEVTNIVYSQPADTGTGKHVMVQVTYAIEFLKNAGTPQKFKDVASYLSLHIHDDSKQTVATILKNHEKVVYDRAQGTYSYRPLHDIRSEQQLLAYLQSQSTAQGLRVKDLRDGWVDAEEAINKLEAKGKVLATRNKKDFHPTMVWPDDPSLKFAIDPEFQDMWHKINIPAPEEVADALEKEGLTPANKTRHVKNIDKPQEQKKKKAPRKGGKTTNKHMEGMLRDYSHLRK